MDHTEVEQNVKDPQTQHQNLETEKQRLIEEFNSQRAKMKELFLQKDAELLRKTEENNSLNEQINKLKNELDDLKSQLVVDSMTLESNFEVEKRKAEEEIATLQKLVSETVEESSSTRSLYDNQLVKLHSYIKHLEKEIAMLKQPQPNTSQEHSLAPSVLNALTKGIKKLGVETFSSQDDDNSKKAGEDTELLKSLVEPLEDQIKALKEKLRATDEQLQKCQECRHLAGETKVQPKGVDQSSQHINMQSTTSTNTSFDMPKTEAGMCDMCSNYEAQLVKEQEKTAELSAKVAAAEKSAERHRVDLLKEIGFRKEMEEKWNEKKEQHKQQVAQLTRSTECTEQDLEELKQQFTQACLEMHGKLHDVTKTRENIFYELEKLQKENDNLIGKYTIHSQELQSEVINLPDTVEELHELVLKNHEELIVAKIAKESAEEKLNTLQSEFVLFKDQILKEQRERQAVEDSLDQEIKTLQKQIYQLEKEKKHAHGSQEKLKASHLRIAKLEDEANEFGSRIKQLEGQNCELKTRVHSLQHELDTTETVQKDFVRLSQNLQVQLEKFRELDHQVRWQHEEDVEECPGCRTAFSSTKKKQHCRHCGQIFCPSCLTRTVPSGPKSRPSKVCDVCHTLLVKDSAPYFSKLPPIS